MAAVCLTSASSTASIKDISFTAESHSALNTHKYLSPFQVVKFSYMFDAFFDIEKVTLIIVITLIKKYLLHANTKVKIKGLGIVCVVSLKISWKARFWSNLTFLGYNRSYNFEKFYATWSIFVPYFCSYSPSICSTNIEFCPSKEYWASRGIILL